MLKKGLEDLKPSDLRETLKNLHATGKLRFNNKTGHMEVLVDASPEIMDSKPSYQPITRVEIDSLALRTAYGDQAYTVKKTLDDGAEHDPRVNTGNRPAEFLVLQHH